MTDRRLAALDRLNTRLAARTGQAATYRRGASSASVTAILTLPASTGEPADFGVAGGLDLNELDAVIAAADLAAIGDGVPELGDYLDTTVAGESVRFKVVRRSGEAVFRYSDPLRTLVRVFLVHHGTP